MKTLFDPGELDTTIDDHLPTLDEIVDIAKKLGVKIPKHQVHDVFRTQWTKHLIGILKPIADECLHDADYADRYIAGHQDEALFLVRYENVY